MQGGQFIELIVIVLFLLGWGVLELVGRRLDKRREEEAKRKQGAEQ